MASAAQRVHCGNAAPLHLSLCPSVPNFSIGRYDQRCRKFGPVLRLGQKSYSHSLVLQGSCFCVPQPPVFISLANINTPVSSSLLEPTHWLPFIFHLLPKPTHPCNNCQHQISNPEFRPTSIRKIASFQIDVLKKHKNIFLSSQCINTRTHTKHTHTLVKAPTYGATWPSVCEREVPCPCEGSLRDQRALPWIWGAVVSMQRERG